MMLHQLFVMERMECHVAYEIPRALDRSTGNFLREGFDYELSRTDAKGAKELMSFAPMIL